ncbi:hypothetical protein [Streptomyces alkaliterrae]|uniref:hypothetical protein n=1 Tax=Streptomyces alkaliterrae TaxID=2213162 RepID=UPI00156485D0|nr:hypothetical protein [Streptomyces alkaliterrae]
MSGICHFRPRSSAIRATPGTAWCGEGPREIVDWLEEEYGEITEAEREAGRAEPAEIGAGNERRRSARRPRRG